MISQWNAVIAAQLAKCNERYRAAQINEFEMSKLRKHRKCCQKVQDTIAKLLQKRHRNDIWEWTLSREKINKMHFILITFRLEQLQCWHDWCLHVDKNGRNGKISLRHDREPFPWKPIAVSAIDSSNSYWLNDYCAVIGRLSLIEWLSLIGLLSVRSISIERLSNWVNCIIDLLNIELIALFALQMIESEIIDPHDHYRSNPTMQLFDFY